MKWFKFDPNKSLVELPIFWLTVILLFSLSSVIAFIICIRSDLIIDLTYEGFNNFFVYYRFPLTTLALIIPIIALIASNHRSVQTKAQISLNNNQNLFSNYYKHIEEFEKFTSNHLPDKRLSINNKRYCYHILFPKAVTGEYRVSNEIYNLFSETCSKLITKFNYFGGGHPKTQSDTLIEIEISLRTLEEKFQLTWDMGNGKKFVHNRIQINVINGQLRAYINDVIKRLTVVNTLMSFDVNHQSPQSFNSITSVSLNKIPSYDITDSKENVINFNLFEEVKV